MLIKITFSAESFRHCAHASSFNLLVLFDFYFVITQVPQPITEKSGSKIGMKASPQTNKQQVNDKLVFIAKQNDRKGNNKQT